MHIYTNIHGNAVKYRNVLNKDYKNILTCIWANDNIGLCKIIDKWTSKNYNVYQKFILMLYIYRECINDKLVYEKDNSKLIFYLDDIIEKMPEINAEHWISINDNVDILIQLPFNFYNKNISESTTFTINETNEYFINNCITHIRYKGQVQPLSKDDINLLPSNIFNNVAEHLKKIDLQLQQIVVFKEFNLNLSLFTMLSIIRFIFNTHRNGFIEFEYAMRRHVRISNFDDITYKYAHDIADIYSHELQNQKDAIEEAKNKVQQ